MSFFAIALKVALERRELAQVRVAELAGINPSLFSRYLAGNVRPSQEVLERICQAFPEPIDRAEIVIAHLKDETPPSAHELVQITSLVGGSVQEQPTSYIEIPIPKAAREDFEYLMRRSQAHPEVIEWIAATVDVLKGR